MQLSDDINDYNLRSLSLTDLISLSELQALQDSFAKANQIAVSIVDLSGNPITQPSNHCDVCKLIRSTEKGRINCMHSGKILGHIAMEKNGTHYHHCLSVGFLDAAAPVVVCGVHVANWLVGQNCVGDVDEKRILSYADEIGIDSNKLLNAFRKMNKISENEFCTKLDFLWLMANQISSLAFNNLESRQMVKSLEKSKQEIQAHKDKLEIMVELRTAALNATNQQLQSEIREHKESEKKRKKLTQKLHKANKNLEKIALTDVLTNLPNRRHAMQQLKKYWEESTQSGKPIFLMMIDADNFKDVNDTYGHDAGDHVLCELSRTLQYSVRTDDVVSRLGGDEFLIICPNTGRAGGLQIAEIIRDNVSQMRVPTGDGYWHGSVSVGVALRSDDVKTFEALIKAADEGVYAAKRAGKNCVRTPIGGILVP